MFCSSAPHKQTGTVFCTCGGAVKIIASIEDPMVIEKILAHLNGRDSVRTTP